ncbi:MAG: 3-phosphoshikimate 1-carboxyvinyltransferase [Thermoanaerobaculia bacterium]
MKKIERTSPLDADVAAPPSKSVTARALLLAAMTEGPTTVVHPLDGDDPRYMLEAIRKAGFEVSGSFRDAITIGERISMSANEVEIFVGNAGTAMRFLTGFLAFTPGRYLITGESRMLQRPIGGLVDALVSIGTELEYAGEEGFPPLRIRGRKMRGGFEVVLDAGLSSQFASALMMAGAALPDGLDLRLRSLVSRPYLEITARILRDFGATVREIASDHYRVEPSRLQCNHYEVEGDYSSASYWFAAAIATGGTVRVSGLRADSAQGDRRFLDLLQSMGVAVSREGTVVTVQSKSPLKGGRFDLGDIPDVVPTLAAIAPLASSPVEIVNIANLRIKESDRIAVIASELRKLGVTVVEGADSLRIEPGWNDDPATIDPHEDHRIAMAFAISGLARGNVTIDHDQVVSKSYPRFWRTLDEIRGSQVS